MTISIKPIDPVSRPFFAGEVSGVDITQPLPAADVSAISAGMDAFGVLVFHDQHFTDETQLAFSRNFGELELATGDLTFGRQGRRLAPQVNDISNLDDDSQVLARDIGGGCSRWATGFGIRIRRSRRCRRSPRCCRRG